MSLVKLNIFSQSEKNRPSPLIDVSFSFLFLIEDLEEKEKCCTPLTCLMFNQHRINKCGVGGGGDVIDIKSKLG